jgi:hypothetical protein
MKICLLTLLALAFASDAAAQQIVRGRPPHAPFAPLRAVDHVATIVRTPISGPQVPFEVVVARSGDWQREESSSAEGVSVAFADFASGASFQWFRAAHGPREEFSATRENPENDDYAYTLTDTGRRETRLGEACAVWEWSKVAPLAGLDLRWLSCVTSDGVELWQGWQSNGEIREYFHAVRVERRRVRRSEVRLPSRLLTWSYWRTTPPGGRGYEVELQSGEGDEHRQTRRSIADWLYVDTRHESGRRTVGVRQPFGRISYYDDGGGSLHLGVHRFAEPLPPDRVEAMPGREPETIAGEICSWFDTMPGVFDGGADECRTTDGVVLAASQWGDGGGPLLNVRATSIRRGTLAAGAFEPPPEVLSVWRRPR